jgi:glycosyltransferase involved in cell wall biosynthesis
VLVAARDESDRIAATLTAIELALPGADVWLADDGSSDGTGEIAAGLGARVVRSEPAVGKGGAVTAAARAALEHAAARPGEAAERAIVVLCDGDLGDSARSLGALALVVAEGRGDLAVAVFARSVGGGFGVAVGFARWAIRRRCGVRTRAPMSGQRALRAGALGRLLPLAPGFGMELGMTIDALGAGLRLTEIELDLAHRAGGRTPAGFAHRGRQLLDMVRAYGARR